MKKIMKENREIEDDIGTLRMIGEREAKKVIGSSSVTDVLPLWLEMQPVVKCEKRITRGSNLRRLLNKHLPCRVAIRLF